MSALCGFCGKRDAVAIDEDDHVPICGVCRDEPVPQPKAISVCERAIAVLRRVPGLTMPELAEILGMEDELPRASLTQTLCRARARGDVTAIGSKVSRRYYAVSRATDGSARVESHAASPQASV